MGASRPSSYDCLVYVALLVALNARGFRVPEEFWREAWKAKCKVLSWATRLQPLLSRSDAPSLRDRVAALVAFNSIIWIQAGLTGLSHGDSESITWS